jgi:hypothetical protein
VIVTGASGSGKSTCVNQLIAGLPFFIKSTSSDPLDTYEDLNGPFLTGSSLQSCSRAITMFGPISLKKFQNGFRDELLQKFNATFHRVCSKRENEEEEEDTLEEDEECEEDEEHDPSNCDIFFVDTEGTQNIDQNGQPNLIFSLIAASSIATVRICCVKGRASEASLDEFMAISRAASLMIGESSSAAAIAFRDASPPLEGENKSAPPSPKKGRKKIKDAYDLKSEEFERRRIEYNETLTRNVAEEMRKRELKMNGGEGEEVNDPGDGALRFDFRASCHPCLRKVRHHPSYVRSMMELAQFISNSITRTQRRSVIVIDETVQRIADAQRSIEVTEGMQVMAVWRGLLAKFCDEAKTEVLTERLSFIENDVIQRLTTVPEAQELSENVIQHQTEIHNQARVQFTAACERRCHRLSHQIRDRFQVAELNIVQEINQFLLRRSRERLTELQEMVRQLELFTDNHAMILKQEFGALIEQEMGTFETALAMSPDCFDFDGMKHRYLTQIEHKFVDGCTQHQNDIKVHISKKMDTVLDDLITWLTGTLTTVRERRLIALDEIRTQNRTKAEEKIIAVQNQFIQQASAEISALTDSQIGDFVQKLITKIEQYDEAAKTAFRQKFTQIEWIHIADCETQFYRRVVTPINQKLQEATQKQKKC